MYTEIHMHVCILIYIYIYAGTWSRSSLWVRVNPDIKANPSPSRRQMNRPPPSPLDNLTPPSLISCRRGAQRAAAARRARLLRYTGEMDCAC